MTTLEWVGLAFALALITLVLGLVVFVAFARADRQWEQRRRARDDLNHPSQRDPWNEQDGPL